MHEQPAADGESDNDPVVTGIRSLLAHTASELRAADARNEALATFQPSRRVLFIKRAPVMIPNGRVWRLGVFLLDAEARLYATGSTTRALEPGRPGFQSLSAETRRMYRAAAYRGPFVRGEAVNFDAHPVLLVASVLRTSTGPLFVRDSRALVRWTAAVRDNEAVELETYLADRVGLLVNPPEGS